MLESDDGGTTWSSVNNLIDATSGGAHPTYTFGSLNLSANPVNGSIVLAYSLVNGAVHEGVFLKEFY